jgi:hypothetical protein
MRLVVTNTSKLWKVSNPFFKQFKEIMLVVCLNGEAVTDEYECFISPCKQKKSMKYGIGDARLTALASVAGKLNQELRYHDDIIFLTDNDPSTLYPFYVLKGLNEHNRFHLITMSPWFFDGIKKTDAYYQMLADLTSLDSIMYYDSGKAIDALYSPEKETTLGKAYSYVRDELESIMISAFNQIYEERYSGYRFFDFASMSYISMKEGFNKIDLSHKEKKDNEVRFPLYREGGTLGLCCPPSYPENSEYTKNEVERPVGRTDGKKICNTLREQRILLAEANNIPFESEECPSIGPCAGTCEKCDKEAKYLYDQLTKIPKEDRVYPQFEVIRSDSNAIQDILKLGTKNNSDDKEFIMGDIFPASLFGEGEK